MASVRYVAIGDSFTEGVGDELPDGTVRGWADLAAQGWADAAGEPIEYANLAIRGKLIEPIVAQQLEPALALGPTHLSFNGGGNDMLRRARGSIASSICSSTSCAAATKRACSSSCCRGEPLGGTPARQIIEARGDRLSHAVEERLARAPTSSPPTTGSTASWRAGSSGRSTAFT